MLLPYSLATGAVQTSTTKASATTGFIRSLGNQHESSSKIARGGAARQHEDNQHLHTKLYCESSSCAAPHLLARIQAAAAGKAASASSHAPVHDAPARAVERCSQRAMQFWACQ